VNETPSGVQLSADPAGEDQPDVSAGTQGRFLVAYQRFIQGAPFSCQRVRARTVVYNDTSTCTSDTQCTTGFCRDGVCCNNACGGGVTTDCQACSVARGGTVDGTCTPIVRGTVCRASAGTCDQAETCDGTTTACPTDAFKPGTTLCRGAAPSAVCDAPEFC